MYSIPNITPASNIISSIKILEEIYEKQKNNDSIGQRTDYVAPDFFARFFAVRGIPIVKYISIPQIGRVYAYEKNIASLVDYINYNVISELKLIDNIIHRINSYRDINLPICAFSLKPTSDVVHGYARDYFLIFFAERELPIEVALSGSILIGDPGAYKSNIEILLNYRNEIESLLINS